MQDGLSERLRPAAREEVLITWNGRPAGVLTGFGTGDGWSVAPGRVYRLWYTLFPS